jgi:predicted CoA-binding protein
MGLGRLLLDLFVRKEQVELEINVERVHEKLRGYAALDGMSEENQETKAAVYYVAMRDLEARGYQVCCINPGKLSAIYLPTNALEVGEKKEE